MLTARREMKRRIEGLRHVPFLADCAFDELARIDRLGTRIHVGSGRVLTHEGDLGAECFVTLDGFAIAERAGQPIGVIGAGSIAGEMALLERGRRNATVVTAAPMELLVLSSRELTELLRIAPRVETCLVRIAEERRAVTETTSGLDGSIRRMLALG